MAETEQLRCEQPGLEPEGAQEAVSGASPDACASADNQDSSPQQNAEAVTDTAPAAAGDTDAEVAADADVGAAEPAAAAAPAAPLSWAQRARASASSASDMPTGYAVGSLRPEAAIAVEVPKPRDSFVDYLAYVAKRKENEAKANAEAEEEAAAEASTLPEYFKRFEDLELSSVQNVARSTHSRLGLRNDANTCYVNVIIQSLLPCSALMWFLRRCGERDSQRPFLSCLVSLCKEFHTRKADAHGGDVFNALMIPQVKHVITSWQRNFGAQQDAGEFLFYLLNGMHEESKWVSAASVGAAAATDGGAGDSGGGAWAQLVKTSRRQVESRAAGLHEDSPIVRIFGGLLQSAVRSRGAKADSVSLEPFNHLDLDISQPNVKCVRTALDGFFSPEAVNDGQQTRRLQLKVLPKVLILSLKRFTFDKAKGGPQKVKKQIKYDQRLVFDRSWFVDGHAPPPEYYISAIICHHGDSVNGGHYTAIVRYNEEWYLYNDALIRPLEGRDVAAQQFDVYLLVYMAKATVDMSP
eukprot:TRINITY_DN3015_c0_g1_i4.p1 TRINITY_DN3015_c0_g1~~TRINITY_DN3015_c0_g1_i4.p1  ORF type:complete len:536 (-),score=113.11 TRINITY_DN3015_c0_g1_i4:74-1645(-)